MSELQTEAATKPESEQECSLADATHFFCMGAEDNFYDKGDQTIEYNLILARLNIDGTPCSFLEWFLHLIKIAKEESTDPNESKKKVLEPFILSSLKIPSMLYVFMLWCAYDEDSLAQLEANPVTDNESLVKHLRKNLRFERAIHFNANSVLVQTTCEFDYEFAFFKPAAVSNNELGPYLSKYIKLSEETGEVQATETTVHCSAYL